MTAFDPLLNDIAAGATPDSGQLLPFLAAAELQQRLVCNVGVADAYLRSGRLSEAKPYVDRAWRLSNFSEELLDIHVAIHAALGDIEEVQEAYKKVAMAHAKAGRVDAALAMFNRWQYAYAQHGGIDRYHYDFEVTAAIQAMAQPFRLPPAASTPPAGGKPRIAYLLFGATQFNSVIVKLAKTFARYHDHAAFDIAFFIPETYEELRASPQGLDTVAALRGCGCQVTAAPSSSSLRESLIGLAREIHGYQAALLVTQAVLADFRHYFVRCLHPAEKTLGFVYGALPQYAPPDLDWAIAANLHPLLDTPVNCSLVPGEVELPRAELITPLSRRELGLPEDAVVIVSGGRHVKFNSADYWSVLQHLAQRHENCRFLLIGLTVDQLPEALASIAAAWPTASCSCRGEKTTCPPSPPPTSRWTPSPPAAASRCWTPWPWDCRRCPCATTFPALTTSATGPWARNSCRMKTCWPTTATWGAFATPYRAWSKTRPCAQPRANAAKPMPGKNSAIPNAWWPEPKPYTGASSAAIPSPISLPPFPTRREAGSRARHKRPAVIQEKVFTKRGSGGGEPTLHPRTTVLLCYARS